MNGVPPPGLPPRIPAGSHGITPDDRSMAMLCHLLGIFSGFLGPLILWLVKKDQSPFVDFHGKEALNFQLSLMLYMVVLGSITFVLMFLLIGLLLVPVIFVVTLLALVAEIIASMAANRGEWYRYPCTIRFVP